MRFARVDQTTGPNSPPEKGRAKRPGVFLKFSPLALHSLLCLHFIFVILFHPSAARAAATAPTMLLLAGAQSGSDLVVVGERTTILRSTDQATTWESASVPRQISATLTGISFAPETESAAASAVGWAVGHDALILSTTDGGRSWKKSWQGENLSESFLDALALDARHVFAVGTDGLCLETNDAGQTWKRRKLIDADRHLNRLTRGPSGTLYLAGERGTLLRSRNAGATWTSLASPYEGSFYGILPVSERVLIAHGLRGRLYRSADDGDTWTQIPDATAATGLIAAALVLNRGPLVFAGQARTIALSRDRGQTISPWPAPIATAVSALIELPDGRILALGEAGATVLPPP